MGKGWKLLVEVLCTCIILSYFSSLIMELMPSLKFKCLYRLQYLVSNIWSSSYISLCRFINACYSLPLSPHIPWTWSFNLWFIGFLSFSRTSVWMFYGDISNVTGVVDSPSNDPKICLFQTLTQRSYSFFKWLSSKKTFLLNLIFDFTYNNCREFKKFDLVVRVISDWEVNFFL
jgi:hypothetical protein